MALVVSMTNRQELSFWVIHRYANSAGFESQLVPWVHPVMAKFSNLRDRSSSYQASLESDRQELTVLDQPELDRVI